MSDFAKRVQSQLNIKEQEDQEQQREKEKREIDAQTETNRKIQEKEEINAAKEAEEARTVEIVQNSAAYKDSVLSQQLREALEFIWNTVDPYFLSRETIAGPELTWWDKLRGKTQTLKQISEVVRIPFDPQTEFVDGGSTVLVKINLAKGRIGHTMYYVSPDGFVGLICEFKFQTPHQEVSEIGIRELVSKEREVERIHYFREGGSCPYKERVSYKETELLKLESLQDLIDELSKWISEYIRTKKLPARFLVPERLWKTN